MFSTLSSTLPDNFPEILRFLRRCHEIQVPDPHPSNPILRDLHDIVAESQDVNGFPGIISGVVPGKVENIALI